MRTAKPASRRSLPRLMTAGVVFAVALLNSPPSTPSMPVDRPEPPTSAQIDALTELSEWVLGGSSAPRFQAFKRRSLVDPGSPVGFELFRRYHGVDAPAELVQRMPFGALVRRAAERYELDPLLLAAIIETESGFDPDAVSVMGAIGLMQVLPTTAALYSDGDPFDPVVNVDVGSRYFRDLLEQFEGDIALALAAYNAGPGNVLKHGGVPPFRETQRYVERVMSRYVDDHQRLWNDSPDRGWFFTRRGQPASSASSATSPS